MKKKFWNEKILLTAEAMISLCIFFTYATYIGEWILIYSSLPDDYKTVTAKVYDWEELDSRSDNDGLSFESAFRKYSYRFTYEFIVDDTSYTLKHDTNYVDKSVSDNTEMVIYYQDNPTNSCLFSMKDYAYLFDKNITFQYGYKEYIFETYYDVVHFLLFLCSIALAAFVVVRVHIIRNGIRK